MSYTLTSENGKWSVKKSGAASGAPHTGTSGAPHQVAPPAGGVLPAGHPPVGGVPKGHP